tara:strand:+ start:116 stop:358 length:243 start_codon:yes stop_codon:yes gene_type:complete
MKEILKEIKNDMDDFFAEMDKVIGIEPKCGMDKLVESLREEKCCTICEFEKRTGTGNGCGANEPTETEWLESKAELHFGV